MILTMGDTAAAKEQGRAVNTALSAAVREMFESDGRIEEDVAAAARITTRTFQRVKNGETGWTVVNLVAVALGLGVDPAAVLVRAGLSARVLDAVSAISSDPTLNRDDRGLIIRLIHRCRSDYVQTGQ